VQRWKAIGKAVPGKNVRSCVERFKSIRNKLLEGKIQEAVKEHEERFILPNLNPIPRGDTLVLQKLFLSKVGWCYVESITVQCSESNNVCMQKITWQKRTTFNSEDASILFLPCTIHLNSGGVSGYVDSIGVSIRSVLEITMVLCCLECNALLVVESIKASCMKESHCHKCHSKMRVSFVSTELKGKVAKDEVKTLPKEGTCHHYINSHRWLWFPCCGSAYPCDICHEEVCSDRTWATRQLCGYCSLEQPYSANKPCIGCGKHIGSGQSKSRHWEGGAGCIDQTLMSKKDSKKFKNSKLKTKSKKEGRTGPKNPQKKE